MGGAIAVFIILAIPLIGFTQEYVLKGRQAVARVNGTTLSLSDYAKILSLREYLLDGQISNLESLAGGQANSGLESTLQSLEQTRASLPNQVVTDWISYQLMKEEAARLGISVTPDEVTAAIKPEFDPLTAPDEEAEPLSDEEFQSRYQEFLKQARTTDAVYRELRAMPLLGAKLEDQLTQDIKSPAPHVNLYAITTATEEQANDALARLQNGDDFAQVAGDISVDQGGGATDGEIGWVPRGLLEKDLEDAVFAAKIGEINGPVEASLGYVVFKVTERDEAREIDAQSMDQIRQNALFTWLDNAEQDAKVERFLDSDKLAWAEKQNRPARPLTPR